MKILAIRRQPPGGKVLARFDLEIDGGIRCYDLKLTCGPNGLRVYGPSVGSGAAVTFPPALVAEIVAIAHEAIANEQSAA